MIDPAAAHAALKTLAHRGPDSAGVWQEGHLFLGHRRLAIIDLATGDQPMHSSDGRYVIVFNGEIYNFVELRQLLVREGASFLTRSDTEVILEGYRRWGPKVLDRLNGMFAFVIWDRLRSTAFGARDRLGIKPLCWSLYRGSLVVSSTLEPFSELPEFSRLDVVAVRDLMTFDYIPAPQTVFKGVKKLEPGSWFEWRSGMEEPVIDRYWHPPLAATAGLVPDEAELECLLECAIERQMVSDVPIGAFLSGGIDSSLLVALMARHSATPICTFSVAFADSEMDESSIASLVACEFGTNHTILRAEDIDADELLGLLGRLDEPFCDPTLIPTYVLAQKTREHVKVALSGDGADEVFGGYPKYLVGEDDARSSDFQSPLDYVLRAVPWRPRGIGRLYPHALSRDNQIRYSVARYGDYPVFRKDISQLLTLETQDAARVHECFHPWDQRARRYGVRLDTDVLMRTDMETYLSENCLVKTDRASMLASLEVRVPFLDESVLDRILPLPAGQKIRSGQLKALLLPIARRLLPRQVWDRPKHGFNVPLEAYLAGRWRPAVEAALDWGEATCDLFDYSYLRRLHAINLSEGGIGRELWNPFVLLAWLMKRPLTV